MACPTGESNLGLLPNYIHSDFDVLNVPDIVAHRLQEKLTSDYFIKTANTMPCLFKEGAFDDKWQLLKPKGLSINKIGHALHDLGRKSLRCRDLVIILVARFCSSSNMLGALTSSDTIKKHRGQAQTMPIHPDRAVHVSHTASLTRCQCRYLSDSVRNEVCEQTTTPATLIYKKQALMPCWIFHLISISFFP